MPDENINIIDELDDQPPERGEDTTLRVALGRPPLPQRGAVVTTDPEESRANPHRNERRGASALHEVGLSLELQHFGQPQLHHSNRSNSNRTVLAPINLAQTFQAAAIAPNQPSFSKDFIFKLVKQSPKEGQENYPFAGQPGRIHSKRYCIRQQKRTGLKLTRHSARGRTRRRTVQKVRNVNLAERRSTMQSIIRGVSHVKSCSGCSRMLCRSTHTLIRRCAQHVQTCPLLDCSACTSCKIARMVQIAWQATENNRVKAPTEKCHVCAN